MSEKKFSIRRCHDIELVKKLHLETFPTDEWYSNPKAESWVVWLDKKPVGFCMVSIWDGKYGFLARAGLLREARGCGLHMRLIKVRESFCRRNGFTKVLTYTKMDNITSNRNLQKAGFYLYIPQYSYADPDCLYWMKELK